MFFRKFDGREQFVNLVIGLGNPGTRYRYTRHNIGFMVLEEMAGRWEVPLKQKSFNALWNRGKVAGKNVLLAMPQTFMNLSGNSVRELLAFFKVETDHLIVVHDDLDLPFGTVRLKSGGGDAGHKGLKSIITSLGSADFMRIRMGIGKPSDRERIESYVLERFDAEECSSLPVFVGSAADAAEEIIISDMQQAMAKYHTKNISI